MILNALVEPRVTELVEFVVDFFYKMMLMIDDWDDFIFCYDASLISRVYVKFPV